MAVFGLIIMKILFEKLMEKLRSINWGAFFIVLIFGSILLAVLFSFTSEGVFVIIGAYFILIIASLFTGMFKKEDEN